MRESPISKRCEFMGLRYVEKLEKKCLDFSEFLLTYLWIVRKAVVLVHPVERAS